MTLSRVLFALALLLPFDAVAQTRTLISTPTTWYVGTLGNDANDCSTPAHACQHIQPTLDKLIAQYDFAANPTLRLLTDGGYPTFYREAVNLNRWVGSAQWFIITGDPNDNNAVYIAPQNVGAFTISHTTGTPWMVQSLTTQCSPGYYAYTVDAGSHLLLQKPNFGQCGVAHIVVEHSAFAEILIGGFTISGGAQMFVQTNLMSEFTVQPNVITFLNNPYFSLAFASASFNSFIWLHDLTGWTGARNIPVKVDPAGPNVAGPSSGTWP